MKTYQMEITTVETICNNISKGRWNLNPSYQRNDDAWSNKDQCLLIESILEGYPIGGAIMLIANNHDDKEVWDVLDGKQRLTAICDFVKNKYKFKTKNSKFNDLNNKFYQQFPDKVQMFIDGEARLAIIKMNEEYAEESIRKNIFLLVNKQSKSLNGGELRHAEFDGTPQQAMIMEIAKDHAMLSMITSTNNKRMKYYDFVSQLIGRAWCYDHYIKKDMPIHNAIQKCPYTFLREIEESEIANVAKRAKKTFTILKELLVKPLGNINSIDGLFSTIYSHITQIDKEGLETNRATICEQIDQVIKVFSENILIGGGSANSAKSFIQRCELMAEVVAPYIIDLDNTRHFPVEIKNALWAKTHEHICPLCNEAIIAYDECEVDHIKPWSKGGLTVLENAQLTHIHCNRSKGNKE